MLFKRMRDFAGIWRFRFHWTVSLAIVFSKNNAAKHIQHSACILRRLANTYRSFAK
jgi:hypothetical protein